MNELSVKIDTLDLSENNRLWLMTKAIALGERKTKVQYTIILPTKHAFKNRILVQIILN
jgi:hypothetical protein